MVVGREAASGKQPTEWSLPFQTPLGSLNAVELEVLQTMVVRGTETVDHRFS